MKKVVSITGNDLRIEDVINVARNNFEVEISDFAKENILKCRGIVDKLVEDEKVVYGITTGFGKFSNVSISKEEAKILQKNLIITHAVGAGEAFEKEVVRAIILLRINNLSKGYSGIRFETVQTMVDMLNKGVHPVIPQKGSLGASGDLAPLSHMVLPMIGLGKAEYKGTIYSGLEAMEKAGINIIELTSKEGLALINGTQVMTAVGVLTIHDSINLMKAADIANALEFEAHNGVVDALQERCHRVRPHKGQIDSAAITLKLLEDSKNVSKQGEVRVQDAYTLRCSPQVHGASKDAINYVKNKIEIEINSVTDNPMIFPDTGEGISGGNFHGQPMALSFDFLGIALAEIANISERRMERCVNPSLSELPAFLVKHGGVNSGFMIVQYSAAALVSENKVLAHPASVDSIPSSANQEDHVSMGTIASRKAREIMINARRVVAMELMCACQAIDLRGNKGLGKGTKAAYETLRNLVPMLEDDRELYEDINKCESIIIDESIIKNVESVIGEIEF